MLFRSQLSDTVELLSADFDFIRLIDVLRQGRPGQPVRVDTRVAIGRGDSNDSFIAEMPPELFSELQSLQDGARHLDDLQISAHELATLKECQLVQEL